MSTVDVFDQRLAAYLATGPTGAPDDVLEGILVELPGVRRRGTLARWISRPVVMRLATAAVVAIAAVATIGIAIPRDEVGGPSATAVPATAQPAGSLPPLVTMPPVAGWVPFVSTAGGYGVDLPADWERTPAREAWPYGEATPQDAPWLDRAVSADGRLEWFGRATTLPAPMTLDDWVADYEASANPCAAAPWEALESRVGSWRVREYCGRFVAVGVIDGTRGVVLSMRPVGIQPTATQVAEDQALFASIVSSVTVP